MEKTLLSSPINFDYSMSALSHVEQLQSNTQIDQINATPNIQINNAYYRAKYPGSLPLVYARSSVVERIHQLAMLMLPAYSISIFDAFRTIETQAYLFELFCREIKARNQHWSSDKVEHQALKFVSHPYDTSRYPVPLHNTGGAIDLELLDSETGQALDFGTAIDTTSDLSFTDFFEQPYSDQCGFSEQRWDAVRDNRRLLFNAMKQLGFVNFRNEWWHYDLGDGNWADELGVEPIYASIENAIITSLK